jgi:DNA-binding GntR family transcriptional regulator
MDTTEKTLTEQAYTCLKTRIQNCDYMPGVPLFEKQLCEELGCGRTPIREALLALKKENLVEIYPRKGMCVKPLEKDYINEIYQLRKLLEATVASKFCHLFDKSALLAYDDKFRHMDVANDQQYYSLDIEFHQFLVSVTNNHTLMEFYARLMQVQYRLGMYSSKVNTAVKDISYTQHHAIIEAILSEDAAEIERTISAHTNYSLVIALKTVSQ